MNVILAVILGLTFAISLFGVLGIVFVPGFFEKVWTKVTRPLGLALVLGWAVVAMAAATQVDLASQVKGVLPLANGGTGSGSLAGANIAVTTTGLSQFGTASTTSAQLATVLSDEVGSGAAMFSPKRDLMDAATFCADAGGTDAYACNLAPAITAYVTGTHYRFSANTANVGAATINFNALGAKSIVKAAGGITTALVDNDIRVGQWVDVVYDGTNMQMQSTLGNAASSTVNFADNEIPTGTINSSNVTFTLAHTVNPTASLNCYENGVHQIAGGTDFTLVTATITYAIAPTTGATLNCSYRF